MSHQRGREVPADGVSHMKLLTTEQVLDAYEAGIKAEFELSINKRRLTCPYARGSSEYSEWSLGKDDAANNPTKKNRRLRMLRLKLAKEKGDHTESEWLSLCGEFDFRCVRCGQRSRTLEKDHIIPIYQRGDNSVRNLEPLCKTCNTSKGPENRNWALYRRSNGFTKDSAPTTA